MNNTHHTSTATALYSTRDEWLSSAAELIRSEIFTELATEAAIALSANDYRVSCGYPIGSRPGRDGKSTTLGVCHPRSHSADAVNEMWITPELSDPVRVLETLVHELIHAADDCQSGHKGNFAKWARAVGLEGKLTATVAGDALREQLQLIAEACGLYPHAEITVSAKPKQKGRMIKISCDDEHAECGAVWRMSAKWAEAAHTCPCCGSTVTVHWNV